MAALAGTLLDGRVGGGAEMKAAPDGKVLINPPPPPPLGATAMQAAPGPC
jgi:hypothetical protein